VMDDELFSLFPFLRAPPRVTDIHERLLHQD
jgi:hypothetical protein